jgi:uncharacterized protein YkwD
VTRHRATRFRPSVQPLDARCLPAAGVTAAVAGGYLVVQGTPGRDAISVALRPVATRLGPAFAAVVSVDGVARFRTTSPFAVVVVRGGDGDDAITITGGGRSPAPAVIDAGAGNDVVNATRAADIIAGGAGADRIWGGGGRDQLDGGDGVDQVNGVRDRVPPAPPVVRPPVVRPPVVPPPVVPTQPQVPTPPAVPTVPGDPTDAQLVADLYALVNLERGRNGLGSLAVSDRLAGAAALQSRNMATIDRMDHTLPEAAQPTLQSRADAVGYRFSVLGENIAYNFRDAGSVHWAWMNSPGHRANLLGAEYTEMGIAVARNARGEIYFTQVFGRPA